MPRGTRPHGERLMERMPPAADYVTSLFLGAGSRGPDRRLRRRCAGTPWPPAADGGAGRGSGRVFIGRSRSARPEGRAPAAPTHRAVLRLRRYSFCARVERDPFSFCQQRGEVCRCRDGAGWCWRASCCCASGLLAGPVVGPRRATPRHSSSGRAGVARGGVPRLGGSGVRWETSAYHVPGLPRTIGVQASAAVVSTNRANVSGPAAACFPLGQRPIFAAHRSTWGDAGCSRMATSWWRCSRNLRRSELAQAFASLSPDRTCPASRRRRHAGQRSLELFKRWRGRSRSRERRRPLRLATAVDHGLWTISTISRSA